MSQTPATTIITFKGTKSQSNHIFQLTPSSLKLEAELVLNEAEKTFSYTQNAYATVCESGIQKKWDITGTYVATDDAITCTVQNALEMHHEGGDIRQINAPPPVPPTMQPFPSGMGQTLVFQKHWTSIELVQAFSHVIVNVSLSTANSGCNVM